MQCFKLHYTLRHTQIIQYVATDIPMHNCYSKSVLSAVVVLKDSDQISIIFDITLSADGSKLLEVTSEENSVVLQ